MSTSVREELPMTKAQRGCGCGTTVAEHDTTTATAAAALRLRDRRRAGLRVRLRLLRLDPKRLGAEPPSPTPASHTRAARTTRKETTMCMSCGCGNPSVEKPDQITQQDLERAARAQGTSVDEVVENIQKTNSSTG